MKQCLRLWSNYILCYYVCPCFMINVVILCAIEIKFVNIINISLHGLTGKRTAGVLSLQTSTDQVLSRCKITKTVIRVFQPVCVISVAAGKVLLLIKQAGGFHPCLVRTYHRSQSISEIYGAAALTQVWIPPSICSNLFAFLVFAETSISLPRKKAHSLFLYIFSPHVNVCPSQHFIFFISTPPPLSSLVPRYV